MKLKFNKKMYLQLIVRIFKPLKVLQNRLTNETLIANSYISSILDVPFIQEGTAPILGDFGNHIHQALKTLNQPVQNWDMLLLCTLFRKVGQFINRFFHR